MNRRLSLLLLIGALLGLFAQEGALAIAPAMPMQATTVAGAPMSADCAEMMGIDKSGHRKPCTGLTLDCIAKMGCALPLAPPTLTASVAEKVIVRGLHDPLPVRQLSGRALGPEPEPPLHLG